MSFRKFLLAIIFTSLALILVVNFQQIQLFMYAKYRQYLTVSPCDKPIAYKLGSLDSRFGIDQDTFLADTKEAASIWQKTEGKQLLNYEPNAKGALTVNLVFDKRSSLNSQINNLEQQVSQKDQSLQSAIASYQKQVEDFKSKLTEFRSRVQALNEQIDYWNKKGGAPPDEYQKLVTQQDELKKEQETLRTEADSLNKTAQKLNLSTQDYNLDVGKLNSTISNFNESLNRKPEEGLFDPQNQTIDIYFVNNQAELIHTLAHEMGHALGLDHNQNPASIMYPYTTRVTTASAVDISSLQAICSHRYLTIPFKF